MLFRSAFALRRLHPGVALLLAWVAAVAQMSFQRDPGVVDIATYVVLYTAAASTLITASMFVTALAPNALVVSVMASTAHVTVTWMDWFKGFAPVGVVLLVAGVAVGGIEFHVHHRQSIGLGRVAATGALDEARETARDLVRRAEEELDRIAGDIDTAPLRMVVRGVVDRDS